MENTSERIVSYDQALELVLRNVKRVDKERAGLINAFGRTLAEDIESDVDVPSHDHSLIDGYALVASNTKNANGDSPIRLSVLEVVPAGQSAVNAVKPGTAIQITSGSPLPAGANAVISEDGIYRDGTNIYIQRKIKPGENIRKAGDEVARGELVLREGNPIAAADLGMLAALGRPGVAVFRKPKVAVITVGEHLVDIMGEVTRGKSRNSNRYSLVGHVLSASCELGTLAHVHEERTALEKALHRALSADVVIISGGSNVGDYGFVKQVLGRMGEIIFWRAAIKPGRQITFARVEGKPVFGLPEDPVSIAAVFEILVRPALLTIQGRRDIFRPLITATLINDVKHSVRSYEFIPAITRWEINSFIAETAGLASSGELKAAVLTNSFVVLPADSGNVKRGDGVEVMLLTGES